MAQLYVNNFETTVGSTLSSGATTLVLASGTGVPAVSGSDFWLLTIEEGANREIVRVTACSAGATSLTVTRQQESTTSPASFTTAATVKAKITKGTMDALAVRVPRVQAVTSAATVTPNADTDDVVTITAQAVGLTLANASGTPVQGQKLIVRIKDNATARSISFGTTYRAMGNSLPTTTAISKTMYLGFIYNSTDTKWDLVASAQEL